MRRHGRGRRWLDVTRENQAFQHLEVLKRNREKRRRSGEIFVEGVACINALLDAGIAITSIAYDRERPLSRWAESAIERARPPVLYRLSPALMAKLSDRGDPSELLVTARLPERSLAEIPLADDLFVTIVERPANPGNLGSLVRSCDAFGADALIATGHCVDLYDPAVIRASLGAIFFCPVIHAPARGPIEEWLARARAALPGLRVVGTRAEASLSLPGAGLSPPVVLVLGNEAKGMGRRWLELVDFCVSIPMSGRVDSLNLACAGSILMYEIRRNS